MPPRHTKALEHLKKADRKLAKWIAKVGPCKLQPDRAHRHNVHAIFEMLVHSIAHQQLTGKAAKTILGRLIAQFPNQPFPTPQNLVDLDPEKIRAAGFSRAKVAAIKDIAAKTLDGTVPSAAEVPALETEVLIERLTELRGVGLWTVEMLLIFELGRLDILPATDFGVRKGFAVVYGHDELPHPKKILEHGERWRPFRSIAAWYLWRAADLSREKKKK